MSEKNMTTVEYKILLNLLGAFVEKHFSDMSYDTIEDCKQVIAEVHKFAAAEHTEKDDISDQQEFIGQFVDAVENVLGKPDEILVEGDTYDALSESFRKILESWNLKV